VTFEKILRSLVWRHLLSLGSGRYYGADHFASLLYSVDVPLAEQEIVLGIYENGVGTLENALVLTSQGLHLQRGDAWTFIPYDAIEEVHFPATKAIDEPKALGVTLANGEHVTIPVTGQPDPIAKPHLRDVWVFGNFLKKVVEAAHDKERFAR
jgi:hypothetical protein